MLGCRLKQTYMGQLGLKSYEKGSVQMDSSTLHLSLQPRRMERSSLMAAALKENVKVWGLVLLLATGFVHAIG